MIVPRLTPAGRVGARPLAAWLPGLVALILCARPSAAPAQTIDTILVYNQNIFDAQQVELFGFTARLANALHITTRAAVIRRTLLVESGEAYDSARVAESERALRALGVFRFVALDTMRVRDRLALLVATADGWSTKPQVSFSSSGGDELWEVGLVEENFLGLASTFVGLYRNTPDRSELELQYVSPHFITRRATLGVQLLDRSDGHRTSWRYGVPFYKTAARYSLETEGVTANERVLLFRDGMSRDTVRQVLRFGVKAGMALRATSRSYLRLWLKAEWRREDYGPQGAVLPYSAFGALGGGVELGRARYRILRQFNTYARREDINLSSSLVLGIWVAPSAWGYGSRGGAGPEFRGQLAAVWPRGFAALRASGRGIYTGAGLDSGRARLSITVADQNLPRQTWILHVEGAVAQRPRPGGEFDLYEERAGPRLFRAHALTGTRMVWGAVENRILVADNALGLLGIGLAPFFEVGATWFINDDPLAWYADVQDEKPRWGGNVGLALRLGPTRAARAFANEFSFGYRFGDALREGHWALTVRKGFIF